jgi:hypothetical protein
MRRRPSHSFVWIENGRAKHRRAERRLERPEKLMADDLVRELARLATEWQDAGFLGALEALFRHEIVEFKDGRFRFTRKREPAAQQIFDYEEQVYMAQVRALVSRDLSERAACDRVAAEGGYLGTSEKLRKRFRRSKHLGHEPRT